MESYRKPPNNKKIYFRLTEEGREMYDVHKQDHIKANREKERLLKSYSMKEQKTILRFLDEMRQLMDQSAKAGNRPD
jgi:DNA-binding MarR family transcriptional regulator